MITNKWLNNLLGFFPKKVLLKNITFVVSLVVNTMLLTHSTPTFANPEGGQVSAGQAVISAPNANTVQINQSSDKAVIDWRTFNISASEQTRFVQPSTKSITLNRIDPTHGASNINGGLSATGQIWLINPAGIVFGAAARVDAAGLLATTAGISNEDFMAGNYRFIQSPDWNGTIINNGSITIKDGGMAALVAPGVENNGVIQAHLGQVILAGGRGFTLDFYGDQLIQFGVSEPVSTPGVRPDGTSMNSAVTNSGKIIANGGKVLMTAKTAGNVLDHAINMKGYVQAKTAIAKKGSVILLAEGSGLVKVSGKINVSGKHDGQKGGSIKVLGHTVAIIDKAKLNASGNAGGGEILIGGNAQGLGPEPNANYAFIGSHTLLNASALISGDGGKVVVWADKGTQFYGTILAKGGSQSGNGGWVETSGKEYLAAFGSVNASAAQGNTGSWLLDPANVTISSAVTSNGTFSGGDPNTYTTTLNTAVANVGTINAALNAGTSVTILTTPGGDGSQLGTITLAAGAGNQISKTGGGDATLTLNAANSITLNNTIDSTVGALNVTLISGNAITINNGITTNGGNFLSTAQNDTTLAAGINAGAGTVTFNVNADGAGANLFTMNTIGSTITTTNTGASAVAINVNAAAGGTGTATLRNITTGSGGTITVATNTGGNATGGSITSVAGTTLNTGAGTVTLTTSQAAARAVGSVGTPIPIIASNLNATSGSSSIFVTNTGTTGLSLGTINTTGGLTLTSTSSTGITNSGTLTIPGTMTIAAGSGQDITLNTAANNFGTTVITSGRNVSLVDTNATILGASTISGTLNVTAGGSITQTGALTVTGTPTFTLTGATTDISLAGFANNFLTTPVITNNGNVRDLLLRNNNAGAAVPTIPTGLRDLTLTFTNASSMALPAITLTRTLSATANGPITQSGALIIPTTATFAAGAANNITLTNPGNNFGTIGITNGNNVSIVDSNTLIFGNTTVSGALNVSTATGTITDTGTLAVTGLTTIIAAGATNNITLNTAGNNFSTIKLTAGSATLVDTNALDLDASTLTGALTLTTGGAITQSGVLNITGITTLSAPAANDITLNSFNNNFSTIALTRGNNVTVKDIDALILGAAGTVTPLTTLSVTAGGNITEIGAVRVTGTPTFTVTAAGSDISIASQANDFSTTPIFAVSGAGTITNLLLRNINASAVVPTLPTGLNNLTLTFNNASSLALPGVTLTGSLSATANGPITQLGTLIVPVTATFASGAANNITLTNPLNDFGSTVITTGNDVSITDANGLTLGTSTVSGAYNIITQGALIQSGAQIVAGLTSINANANNVTLATSTNNFGTIQVLNGANISLRDANSLILDDIAASGTLTLQIGGVGNAITQALGKSIQASGTTTLIGTSANDITLANSGNDFATVTTTSGNNVNLHDTNSVILGASTISGTYDVTAGGSISQSGVLTVTGTPTFTVTAAASDISLASSINNFSTTPVFTNNGNIRDLLLRNANNGALVPTLPAGLRNLTLNFSGTAVAMALPSMTLTGDLSATATGAITQTGALSGVNLTALTLNATGAAITLSDPGNNFSVVNLQARNAGNTANTAGAITYQDSSGFDVALLNTSSTATLTSAGDMTDSGALTVGGLTTLAAGTANIIFDLSTNNFNTVAINSGHDVTLRDSGAIILDTSTVGNNLNIISGASGSAITQIGAITAPTLTAKTLNNAGGAITFDDAANAVTYIDLQARNTLDTAYDTGIITFNSSGSFDVAAIGTATTISLTSGNAITDSGNITGTTLTTNSVNGTILDFGSNLTGFNATNTTLGDISLTNTGTLSITGISQSGGGHFILNNTGTTTVTGTINTNAGNTLITSTGAVTDSTAGTILSSLLSIKTLANAGAAITLDNIGLHDVITLDLRARNLADSADAAGAIIYRDLSGFDVAAANSTSTVTLTGLGALTQTGSMTGSTLTAKTLNNLGALINFDNSSNHFTNISLQSRNAADNANASGAITYQDSAGFNVTLLNTLNNATLISAGAITDSGALTVSGLTTLSSAAANITLDTATNDFNIITITSGNNVILRDANAAIFGNVNLTGTLAMTTAGTITQDIGTAMLVSGATTLTAGAANNITLENSGNDFSSMVIVSGNDVSLRDTNALNFGVATSTMSGNLDVTTNGPITQTGAISVAVAGKTATFAAGSANDITLSTATNNFTNLSILSGKDVTVRDAGAIVVDTSTAANSLNIIGTSITQLGAITTPTLIAKTLNNAGGAITLDNVANTVSNINLQARNTADTAFDTGAITYANSSSFNVTAIGSASPVVLTSVGGDITFDNDVALASSLTVDAANNGSVTFNGNAVLNNLITLAQPYEIIFNGSSNTFTNAITFNNTNGVSLINNGVFNFINGLTSTASTTTLASTINTTNSAVTLGSVILSGNSAINTSDGDFTVGVIAGGTNNLELDTGSLGNILFNGNAALGNLTIFNVNNFTNAATINLAASYQQNAGNMTNLGTSTLNAAGNANITSTSVLGNMNVTGSVTINAETVNGTVNVGGLTLNVSGPIELFGSVGGSVGQAAVNKIIYTTPPPGLQFFDGIDLSTGGSSPIPPPIPPTPIVNPTEMMLPNIASINAAPAEMSSINLIDNPPVAADTYATNYNENRPQAAKVTKAAKIISDTYESFNGQDLGQIKEAILGTGTALFSKAMREQSSISDILRQTANSNFALLLAFFIAVFYLGHVLFRRDRFLSRNIVNKISFNLRSSLNNIIGFAEIIATEKLGKLSTEQNEYINHILTSAIAMKNDFVKEIEENRHLASDLFSKLSFKLRTQLDGIRGFSEMMMSEKNGLITTEIKECLVDIIFSANEILSLPDEITNKLYTKETAKLLSFDLRTAVNNIAVSAELIHSEKLGLINPAQKEFLADILNCSDKMANLTSEIESTNHITEEQLQSLSFNLRTLLDNVMGFAGLMHEGKLGHVEPEVKEYLGYILLSSNNMLRVPVLVSLTK